MLQKSRFALVVLGLVAAELAMLFRPAGDANGDVALFPHAALWYAVVLFAWAVLMTGMFAGNRTHGNLAPLVLGTVGAALLIAANH